MATAQQVLEQLAALAGENEAVVGQNNTTINKYFNAPGQAYCGYSLWYAAKKAGSGIFDGCSNPAYVPTLKSFFTSKRVPNTQARAGDIFAYKDQHVGFIYEDYSGGYCVTLEGNSKVFKTLKEAKNSYPETGSYEGIGYKKRNICSSAYSVYRPNYDGVSSAPPAPEPETHDNKTGAACTVTLALCQNGNSGPMIKTIQRILYAYGLKGADGKPVVVDGEYGANTVAAVKSLQAKLGVPADGVVGKDTWTTMLTKLW